MGSATPRPTQSQTPPIIHEFTISAYHEALLAGTTTSEATIAAYLTQISTYNPTLNALITVNTSALSEARQKDQDLSSLLTQPSPLNSKPTLKPLHAVPLILKDTYTTAPPLPTTAGVLALSTLQSTHNAPVVSALLAAGAIILAKANLHELSLEGTTTSSILGQTLNPYDVRRTPGGSSGGTAAALAANMALAGCGGDTMNSLRSPASACSIVGLRMSKEGGIGTEGVVPVSTTQDVVGPMGRSVADVRLLMEVMAGRARSGDGSTIAVADNRQSIRIGMVTSYLGDESTAEGKAVNRVMDDALNKINANTSITFHPLPPKPHWAPSLLKESADTQPFEFKEALDAFLSSPLHSTPHSSLASIAASNEYHKLAVTPVFNQSLHQVEIYNTHSAEYRRRLDCIAELKRDVNGCFEEWGVDALVYPHQRCLAVPVPESASGDGSGSGCYVQPGRNGILASLTGRPAVCLPAGFSDGSDGESAGIPIGLELMGKPGADDELLDIAEIFEQVIQGRRPPNLDALANKQLN